MFKTPQKKPLLLCILDGWGLAPDWGGNAISQAKTPNFSKAWKSYASTSILASGDAVGLPTNAPGNSEAGHLNIGAGRVIHQDITLIDSQIDGGAFFSNARIIKAIEHAKENHSGIHLIGLLSKTGTHSHIRHLYALLVMMRQKDFRRVYIHLFSDGRDSEPTAGLNMAKEVEAKIAEIGIGRIASVGGRFYGMDRDNRWGRLARAYNLLVKGEGNAFPSIESAFRTSYDQGITDEFIEPRLIASKTESRVTIGDNDTVIIFNFRGDRVRQITQAFLDDKVPAFPDRLKLKNIHLATFVIYDENPHSAQVFSPEKINNPLAKVWSARGLRQFHTAETEKYPHVTYFFNGGVEKPFPGEDRLLIPSPRHVKTYDYLPEMSATKVTNSLLFAIKSNVYDCLVVNFANPDMVGHSGNLGATVQAVEHVDKCLGPILAEIINHDGTALIFADHGNAEQMINPETGEADTEHTTNPVPFIVVGNRSYNQKIKVQNDGILASIAPTALDLAGLPKPEEMHNASLLIKEEILNATPNSIYS
ncbi:MAG: 2,3-bisphosphoglycerate-independent phosphoglycerate mutase [Patescibacteria group bacterium]